MSFSAVSMDTPSRTSRTLSLTCSGPSNRVRTDGSACFLRDDEELDGEGVLPGLRIRLASLFE
jgi:hypothetical protein